MWRERGGWCEQQNCLGRRNICSCVWCDAVEFKRGIGEKCNANKGDTGKFADN